MKRFIAFIFIILLNKGFAQINVTPMPASVKMGKGSFILNRNTIIVTEGSHLEKSVSFFNNYLQANFGYKLKTATVNSSPNSIVLNYERLDNALPGAYHLTVDKKGVYIGGDNEEGVFYGIQTLIQLMPVDKDLGVKKTAIHFLVPNVSISDYPRFAYRGMHLDVCRHFFPVEYVKKYIDYLAFHKFNNFHWHLTDDQGWRIEIKKYPLLTQVGSQRDGTIIGRYPGKGYDNIPYGGFYTQAQVKEIVKYAADRYINVVPEIEMPGHSTAALASYPYLGCTKGPYKVLGTWGVLDDVFCAGNDSTFTFLQNVLDEILPLFPSKLIHIGGDECPKERWKTCPFCQKRIKDEHLKDEHELQSYFVQRIEKYLNSKGRKIIGWDEILEGGLAPNASVMSWRGEEGGIAAAKQGHDVVMTPGTYCYLDHAQSKNEDSLTIGGFLPLDKVYSYEPVPKELSATEAKHILGAQGNLWTEYISNPAKIEYMLFPRMSALSEVLWTAKEKRNWADFERRIPALFERYEFWGANYSGAYYDLTANVMPATENGTVLFKLESKNKNLVIRYMDDELKTASKVEMKNEAGKMQDSVVDTYWGEGKTYKEPIVIRGNNTILASSYKGKTQMSNTVVQHFSFNKATGRTITLVNQPSKSYPGNGAFTLVDGVQNEKGMGRSSEFLGFLGKDLDAMIDLNQLPEAVNKITIHVLDQNGSWIYLPSSVEVTYLPDMDFTPEIIAGSPKETIKIDPVKNKGLNKIVIEAKHDKVRYLHIVVKNFGNIPSGNPGAGTAAWLFVDEIEVE